MGNETRPHRNLPHPTAGQGGKKITRRDLLRFGILTTAGLLLPDSFTASLAAQPIKPPARAKSVIQVWLWGGPSHLDTFDPKPAAGYDYCGPLKTIPTNVDGIIIDELLPLLAKQADKFSLIRSMTHGSFGHETAAYIVQTGRWPGDRIEWPSIGAVVSYFKGYGAGYTGLIPPYIVLTQLQGRFSEAGFLGQRYKPFATGGDPARTPFAVQGVVAEGISNQRQLNRRDLLHQLNTMEHAIPDDRLLLASNDCEKQAYDLITGDAGKVFDLSQEKPELRDQYGRTTFGQSCLVARRLVEHGVPYITINSGGWDTHKQNFQAMHRLLPVLDAGLSTLLQDLSDRGLLDSTLIWCCGEFGRTPKIMWDPPWDGGRGHWGDVFTALVAGGGFKGGHLVGASDDRGEQVKDRPVYPMDLLSSMYELLGIDLNAKLPHPEGLDTRVAPSPSENVKTGGLLKEIM